MAKSFSCCRQPTWTRVFVLAIPSVAAATTSGCSFADYSKSSTQSSTLTPACAPLSAPSADAATPDGLVAQWRFDDEPVTSAPPWLDTQEQRKLVLKPDGASPAVALTRLNGHGHALRLDGNTYAQDDTDDEGLFPVDIPANAGFTVSAWISLRLEDLKDANTVTRIWPIVSTLGTTDHCGGYQLDVRSESTIDGPVLAFSYEYPTTGDAGTNCSPPKIGRAHV